MTSNGTYISRYDQRVQLVAAALTARSELTEQAAMELARHVLYALDHIPREGALQRKVGPGPDGTQRRAVVRPPGSVHLGVGTGAAIPTRDSLLGRAAH